MSERIVLVIGLEADQPFGRVATELMDGILTRCGEELRPMLEPFGKPDAWGNEGNGNTRVYVEIRKEQA